MRGRAVANFTIAAEGFIMNLRNAGIDLDNAPADADLQLKIGSVTNSLQNLFDWIVAHQLELTVQSFFAPGFQDPRAVHNSTQMLIRLKDVLTRVAGNINGYHKELEWASRKISKPELGNGGVKRQVHFGSRGDVAIDYGGGFGIAMQSKSCFAAGYTDVDNHIKKAALQLTGEKVAAETPLAQDRRLVDISIKNPNNRWPKTDADHSALTLDNIVQRIHNQVSTYVAGKRGYNKWNELGNNLGGNYGTGSKGNLISRTPAPFTGNVGIDFVVKIRWDQPRQVIVPGKMAPVNITQVTTRTEQDLFGTTKTVCLLYKSV